MFECAWACAYAYAYAFAFAFVCACVLLCDATRSCDLPLCVCTFGYRTCMCISYYYTCHDVTQLYGLYSCIHDVQVHNMCLCADCIFNDIRDVFVYISIYICVRAYICMYVHVYMGHTHLHTPTHT